MLCEGYPILSYLYEDILSWLLLVVRSREKKSQNRKKIPSRKRSNTYTAYSQSKRKVKWERTQRNYIQIENLSIYEVKFALIETANIYTDAAAAAAVTATIIVFAVFKHVFPLCFGSLVGFFFLSLATKDFCYFIYLRLPFGIFTIGKSLTRQQSNRNHEQNSKN